MAILVIVESPGKIKKIQSILGDKYIVKASVGHIQDLAEKNLSIDIVQQNDKSYIFVPKYEILSKKKQVVSDLIKVAKNCDEIIIATDDDREGEFIAFSLQETLKLKNAKRISFNEITKDAIFKALSNPKTVDIPMVHSQKTRRILDRLIGYKIYPYLGNGLSAGRVQSVVVKIIIDKDDEIKKELENLKKIYSTTGTFDKSVDAKLYSKFDDVEKELKYLISINPYYISDIINKIEKQNPSPPYITSTLQQDAINILKFSSKLTMSIAQKLYEKGYITYMRTDSVSISKDFSLKLKSYITKEYGEKYYTYRTYKNKSNSQEAHECIRPTSLIEIQGTDQEIKLYNMIFKRTIACQMASSEYESQELIIKNKEKDFNDRYFQAKNRKLLFDGYQILFNVKEKDDIKNVDKNDKINIHKLICSEEVDYHNNHYSEATLIKTLESLEIGRPSTYSYIINTIIDRNYVSQSDIEGKLVDCNEYSITIKNKNITSKIKSVKIGFEKKRFIPTETGIKITDFLVKNFPEIFDVKFTVKMEKDLDRIAEDNINMQFVLNTFYGTFIEKLNSLEKMNNPESKEKYLGEDELKNKYYVLKGKYGWVLKKEYLLNSTIQFFPLEDKEINLENALVIGKTSQLLGNLKKKPIFLMKGKFGVYIKYNGKNYNTKNIDIKNLDDIKKLIL